jgi:cobaltochelatase CobN
MHLLATQVAGLEEAEAPVDLGQSCAEMVILSFSDSDLSALAAAWTMDADVLPTLRLASLKQLRHPMSADLYVDRVVGGARAVVVRCLGGLDYWRYGLGLIEREARRRGILFAALPGDDRPDPRLADHSTAGPEVLERLHRCLAAGGTHNARSALRYLARQLGRDLDAADPEPVEAVAGLLPDGRAVPVDRLNAAAGEDRPVALVTFYRAGLLAGDVAPVTALMAALEAEGMAALAVAVASLREPAAEAALAALIAARRPRVILNSTAFSALRQDGTGVLDAAGVPVLQVVLAGSAREAWAASPRGLAAADVVMNVVLPELDGRLLTRAISFKAEEAADPRLEFAPVRHRPEPDRITFVARLAAAWVRLGLKARPERRLALALSDYPARPGRTGYAVGLDTAASAAAILALLRAEGYDTGEDTPDAAGIQALLAGRAEAMLIPLGDYAPMLAALPPMLQSAIAEAWGSPADDPAVRGGAFEIPVLRVGKVLVLLQPDRGSASDRKTGYHDAATPPRHAFVAAYAALREREGIDALVHLGTHGTLEWLPGKAMALAPTCWPEAVLGPVPVIYPYIVNDPGEAVQAKRRLAAVTIGHLTPPMASAGLHGDLALLEGLVEEYAGATGLDRRRAGLLEAEIIERAWAAGLAAECGLDRAEPVRSAIGKLDARLCDIKELSVREGLHVFGRPPEPAARTRLAEAVAAAAPGADLARIHAAIDASAAGEREGLLAALDGRRVPPGPAGAPSRGRADVLPTGRNLTTIDPRAIPTRVAARIGARAAEEVVRRHLQAEGEHPRALVLDLWASAALRTGGDDIAEALAFLGVRPAWDAASGRVTGVEVLPPAVLERPRIDVTLRISGLFRDVFEAQIALFDLAVRKVAALDEDEVENPLAAARRRGEDLARVFGGAPGTYGAGTAAAALETAWTSPAVLGAAYLRAGSHAYGTGEARPAAKAFAARVAGADALVHPRDDGERDILDGDGAADFVGGFAAAAESLGGRPALWCLDTSRPAEPRVRSLAEEVARTVRGRLASPRWIEAMLRHGHRGVAEIAEGVDALYVFAATTKGVPGHLFDAVHAALIADESRLAAMTACNPAAVGAIAARLADARRRGLWAAGRNAVAAELERAAALAGAAP